MTPWEMLPRVCARDAWQQTHTPDFLEYDIFPLFLPGGYTIFKRNKNSNGKPSFHFNFLNFIFFFYEICNYPST